MLLSGGIRETGNDLSEVLHDDWKMKSSSSSSKYGEGRDQE